MLAGTDAGNPFCFSGFSLHVELAVLVEAGMTPLGALQAATRNPALFMDANDRYGSHSAGEDPDLVLVDADPQSARHGLAWYELDLNWYGVSVFTNVWLGLGHQFAEILCDARGSVSAELWTSCI